jgi:hypothetical protein
MGKVWVGVDIGKTHHHVATATDGWCSPAGSTTTNPTCAR